jgi:hypothetical protein
MRATPVARWRISTRHKQRPWEVIVEPDDVARVLVVVTPIRLPGASMKETYLEVTYRHGKPLAGYPYLPRRPQDRSARVEHVAHGLAVDYRRDCQPIGIEITAPGKVSLAAVNRVLRDLGLPAAKRVDLAPLLAA